MSKFSVYPALELKVIAKNYDIAQKNAEELIGRLNVILLDNAFPLIGDWEVEEDD